jgi:YD repeat-containing protein
VSFSAAGSSDADGTITKYEWDLDGNGSYETDTGATATTSRTYAAAATLTIGVRVTDNDAATGTATKVLSVKDASYRDTVLGTAGLRDYWRMGETSGTALADSKGARTATLSGGTLGAAGALDGDANGAVSFNGTNAYARAPLTLSNTSVVTVEFWLKWNAWANDDALALEYTDNFNGAAGGFLVDPNASNGRFGVAIGQGGSRNTTYFTRPSAGVWHHYAFVLDTGAAADSQVIPYVDGQLVSYFKGDSGTGGGPFADANLYFMSRVGAALFGAGVLDELAVYDSAVSAPTVAQHYAAGIP